MGSPFDFSTVLLTIDVASMRVIPEIIAKFSFPFLYETIIALNPIVTAFWLTGALILLQILLSILTRSFSWNDRFWTFIPLSYAILYTIHPVISQDRRTNSSFDVRLTVMASLIFIWGMRLNVFAYRRGYFSPGETDYRYTWVRKNLIKNPVLFAFVYATSVCSMLTLLLALVSSPLYFAWLARGRSPTFTYIDWIAAIGVACGIILETAADIEQQIFQYRKAQSLKRSTGNEANSKLSAEYIADMKDGFTQSGLFSWSRHPNYFGEVVIWFSFYLFSVSTSGRWINWSLVGGILNFVMFQSTTLLTEVISSQKYAAYGDYKKRVSKILPSPFSQKRKAIAKGTKDE